MINAAQILAAETEIQAGDTEVIDEGDIIRTGAQGAEMKSRRRLRFLGRRFAAAGATGSRGLEQGFSTLWIFEISKHLAHEHFERVRA